MVDSCKQRVRYKLLVVTDNPCHSESFRPTEDKSQWWARRDALVRILFAQQQGQRCSDNNGIISDLKSSYIMFHNGNANAEDKSVSIMSVAVSDDAYMSEEEIISSMKKCSKNLSKTSSFLAQQRVSCDFLTSFLEANVRQPTDYVSFNETAAKKDILAAIQKHCHLDHIRKHNLNSSTEVVLKKRNAQQLRLAWDDWLQTSEKDKNNGETNQDHNYSSEEQALIDTFTQLFLDCKGESSSLVVLLLHEDFKHELPVFGDLSDTVQSYNTSARLAQEHTVLCVLGAVRDMNAVESRCLWTAAKNSMVDLVTANLGRTAEFTSKIVMALRGHALHNDRLFFAVRKLFNIQQQEINHDSELLQKVTSIRGDHSTWDGYVTSRAQPVVTIDSCHLPTAVTHGVMNEKAQKASFPYMQHIIVSAYVSYPAASISVELSRRNEFLPCLRLMVYTLWKSRLVCDTEGGLTVADNPLTNELYLAFSCGSIIRISQSCIAQEVATHHSPAPSEYQLLTMLQRIISSQATSTSTSTTPLTISQIKERLLRRIFEGIEFSFESKLSEVYTVPVDLSQNDFDGDLENIQESLADAAYRSSCWCNSDVAMETCLLEKNDKILLLVCDISNNNSYVSQQSRCQLDVLIAGALNSSSISRKLKKRIRRGFVGPVTILPSSINVHLSLVICLLQHWAYHGQLFPALAHFSRDIEKACDEILKKEKKSKRKRKRETPHECITND